MYAYPIPKEQGVLNCIRMALDHQVAVRCSQIPDTQRVIGRSTYQTPVRKAKQSENRIIVAGKRLNIRTGLYVPDSNHFVHPSTAD
jgi:hypothetical protein